MSAGRSLFIAMCLLGCEVSPHEPVEVCAACGDTSLDANGASATAVGRVRYLKRLRDADGPAGEVWRPAGGVEIEVRRAADLALLASGTTDSDGRFAVPYPDGETVRVVALAAARGPRLNIQVLPRYSDDGGAPWQAATDTGPEYDIDVSEAYAAGAFNVIAQAHALAAMLQGAVHDDLPAALEVRYSADWRPACGSCFYSTTFRLDLGGAAGEEDAHDDSVVLHELGHYLEAAYGRYSNPGGPHDLQHVAPPLAWSEGFATWVQAVVRGRPDYVDVWPVGGPYVLDLESPPPSAFGTQIEGDPTSRHSEALVYGLLWDLVDDSQDEPVMFPTLDALASALGLSESADRPPAGADLIDFLATWRCRFGDRDAALGQLLAAFQYPYDVFAPAGCP